MSVETRTNTHQQSNRMGAGELAALFQYLGSMYPTQFVDSFTFTYDAATNTSSVTVNTTVEKYPGQMSGAPQP